MHLVMPAGVPWSNGCPAVLRRSASWPGRFDMALPTIVQHLGVLEKAGIVTSAKAGRVRTYQLVPGALAPAGEWISRQQLPAERRLDRLGAVLSRSTTTKEGTT